jgi:replicative DNA helicase
LEAERACLGSMMTGWDAIDAVLAKLDPDNGPWFYDPRHNVTFDALVEVFDKNLPVDAVILRNELERCGTLEKIGGIDYIIELSRSVPSAANAGHYAGIVREMALRRRKIVQAERETDSAYDLGTPITDTLPAAPGPAWMTLGEIGGQPTYTTGLKAITTGFAAIDAYLTLRQECMYILGGRTGYGKTTLISNMVRRQAIAGHSVLLHKLEETCEEATYRIHAAASQVPLWVLLDGKGTLPEWQQRLRDGWDLIHNLPIRISTERSLEGIERISRRHVEDGGELVYLDQLSMVTVPGADVGYETATIISNRLRALAKELRIPIVVVSQINRAAAKNAGHLSVNDLRDSGCLENDAAGVILIDGTREPDGPQYSGCDRWRYLQILVGKNRYGRTTDPEHPIELLWHPAIARIEEPEINGGVE